MGWAQARLVRCLDFAKGKLVKIPVLDSARGATRVSFGICLRQRKRTSSQEKEAAAEMSFLFKKVKRGVWRAVGACGGQPLRAFGVRQLCPLNEWLIRIIL